VNPSLGGEPAPSDTRDGLSVYVSELGRHRLLAPDEELRLSWAARAGDRRAAARLVESNLPLVIAVARRYATGGVAFLDLVQEANIGLMQAVEGFDPGRRCRFSTYAHSCVDQAVRRAAADQGRLVRIPPATAEAMDRLRRAADRLTQALGRAVTAEELASEVGTTTQRVRRLERLARPRSQAANPDPGLTAAEDEMVLAALRIDLYAMLARLTARERRVLRLRYGLVDGRRCSLDEIGRRLGLSRERIRQIDREALHKVRQATGALGLTGSSE
jgi:RNA polymerase primary sigma factor